ncbi:RagB/SusD family nutrient uptake outer membrane protein [Mucilaginibacter aquaedulcis]|uniref:RagB/SusD family nutrient uptake outer membrane protein n=1 Tax=Mucilaginibacter aquaedulcis TaxID=1187081 RepID=UPI0025B4422B|nr:RagB/SusD family nutrient uptake outer membrane protein [Mucilaginibacter aquaedulcis]MDN3549315.1 RagB/SusD family nutrient uptake outer membrane protein [Mucilaginibacter aquaedulcis]
MKKYKYLSIYFTAVILLVASSCKKQLDVKNPNSPTKDQAKDEPGIISLSTAAVYLNGFNGNNPSIIANQNWLGDSYFSLGIGFHELLGDNISAEASNQNINVVNLPDYVIFDNGTRITNTSPSKSVLRISNARDKKPANMFFYEWAYMYSLNNACNQILSLVDDIKFSGDAETKKNTIKAWAYWWKGFAYSKIGSTYYAGIINNAVGVGDISSSVSTYVTSAAMIEESNKNFDQASTLLSGITSTSDYSLVLGKLLPNFVQTGKGGILTTAMWIRNINTMKARNLLVNKRTSAMTATDWNAVLTLVNNGIKSDDLVFTGRTTGTNGFFSAGSGSVAAMTTGLPKSATFKVSERLIQEYKTGDKRLAANFTQNQYINQVGGFSFSTRWQLLDANGVDKGGVAVLSDKTPGNYELFIGSSYEENELMKAEALINTGNIATGVASIDNVRNYQGAGLPALSGSLSFEDAKEELRRERRVALVFRGIAFFDARRWGVIDDISKGGGRTNAVVLGADGVLSTHATINYNFLDYWDVPADESVVNPPAAGSAPIKNPN